MFGIGFARVPRDRRRGAGRLRSRPAPRVRPSGRPAGPPGPPASRQAARDDIRGELGPGVRRLRAHRPRPAPRHPQAPARGLGRDARTPRRHRSGPVVPPLEDGEVPPYDATRPDPPAGPSRRDPQPVLASSVTSSDCRSPSRTTVSLIGLPRLVAADRDDQRDAVGDASCRRRGHDAVTLLQAGGRAGVPVGTSATVRAVGARAAVLTLAPMTGYCALPVRRICPAVTRTCSMGIAKPTPMLPGLAADPAPGRGDRGVHPDDLPAQVRPAARRSCRG